MAAFLLFDKITTWNGSAGELLAGGQFRFFEVDTTTPQDVYGDRALTVNNGVTVDLDGAGVRRPILFLALRRRLRFGATTAAGHEQDDGRHRGHPCTHARTLAAKIKNFAVSAQLVRVSPEFVARHSSSPGRAAHRPARRG